MGRLGDALGVLYGPDDRIRTVRAAIRQWRDDERARSAMDRGQATFGVRRSDAGGPEPAGTSTSTLAVWLSRPGCVRIEKTREVDDGVETRLVVSDGDRRWECDPEGHVEVSEGGRRGRWASGGEPVDIDVDRHFHPWQIRRILQELTLESLGPVRTAGRDCERVRGVLRPGGSLWPHWLPKGAEEYELHVDVERGAVLSIASRNGGEAFEVCEVTEVAFDEPIDPIVFVYEIEPGDQVGPKPPGVERLSLAAAVARMPFTVLVPTRVPDPDHTQLEVMHHPPRRRKGWANLILMYRGSDAYRRLWVDQSEHLHPGLDHYQWEPVAGGEGAQNDLRISDPGEAAGGRLVAFEQQGTHVQIRSDLDRTRLIDFATSFAAASGSTAV